MNLELFIRIHICLLWANLPISLSRQTPDLHKPLTLMNKANRVTDIDTMSRRIKREKTSKAVRPDEKYSTYTHVQRDQQVGDTKVKLEFVEESAREVRAMMRMTCNLHRYVQ